MYKKAIRLGLTLPTPKGELTITQAFKLSVSDLRIACIAQNEVIKKQSGGSDLDFLEESKVDSKEQLRFDLLKDIYQTKVEEAKEAVDAKAKKERLNQLLALKAKKEQEALEGMSAEQLDAEIAKLQG